MPGGSVLTNTVPDTERVSFPGLTLYSFSWECLGGKLRISYSRSLSVGNITALSPASFFSPPPSGAAIMILETIQWTTSKLPRSFRKLRYGNTSSPLMR